MSESKRHRREQYREPPPKDHLLVHDAISMSLRTKRFFPEWPVHTLVSLCGSIGTLLILQGFFQFPIQMKPLLIVLLSMTLILRLIRTISPKVGFAVILLSFSSIPLLLLKYREPAVVGAGAVYDVMRRKILWQSSFPPTNVHAGDWTEAQCVQLVFLLIVIALVALLEYSDVLLTHPQSSRSGFWIRFLVTFPFLECGLYFGIETSSIAVFMVILFWIGSVAIARHRPGRRLAEAQGISNTLQQNFLTETCGRYPIYEAGTALTLCCAAVLASAALYASKSYVRTEEMNQKRRELREFYQSITIEDVTGLLQRIPGSFGANILSDEVDLMQNSDVFFDGRPVLHLTVGAAAVVDDYYLRGIVRAEYTGRGWALPTGVYRKNQRLFRRLTAANRMPQTVFHSDHVDELRTAEGKFPVVRCTVQALTDEKVNYLPYQSIFDVGTKYRYDIETELDDTRQYGFWIMNNAQPDWALFSARTAPSQEQVISDYEAFVEAEYLNLPETEAMARLAAAFEPDMPDAALPLKERLTAIRDYIWARADYTMQPGAQPQDQDFVEYFLTEGHKGFCAHYASAAVVLCRMCGIPARYCQGYVLTENDFLMGRSLDSYEINIPDNQAHAWAEIYVKGYGWVPFEFTETVEDTWHQPIETTAETTTAATVTTTTVTVSETETASQSTASSETTVTTTERVPDELPGLMTPEQAARLRQILLRVLYLAAVLLLYYGLHRLIIGKREKAMRSKDPNQAAQAAYLFLMHLLHIQGIDQQKLSHGEFAAKAESQCDLLPKGRITRAIEIQQAAVFSRNGISQADARILCKTAHRLADAMYRKANPLRKLWLRWGRHIVR